MVDKACYALILARNQVLGREGKKQCLFQEEQNTTPSMMEAVQCNHSVTGCLADHPREWCHIKKTQSWSLLLED